MTLFEIRNAAAAYLHRDADELEVNDVDLGLSALNQVRQNAEQANDFGFTRKLLALTVDGVSGGSLDDAVEQGTTSPPVEVKTVVDVGTFDADGNFCPAEWTTVAESLNRQRADNPHYVTRYPTDAQAVTGPMGWRRFVFSGNKVFWFPKTPNVTFDVGLEAYTFTPDWTEADLDENNTGAYDGPWTQKGSQYLLWSVIIHLNQLFRDFVFRQEGNLPPPQTLADQGLQSLITWDIFKYEQFRRHGR